MGYNHTRAGKTIVRTYAVPLVAQPGTFLFIAALPGTLRQICSFVLTLFIFKTLNYMLARTLT